MARGIANYSEAHASLLRGKHSAEYHEALGWHGPEEVVHRHNLVLLADAAARGDD